MNIKTTFFLFILNSYFILKLTKSKQIRLKFEKKRNRNLDICYTSCFYQSQIIELNTN